MVTFVGMLKRIVRYPVEFLCGFLMVGITGVVFLQVVSRYVFHHPFDWPEELARFLFVWVALLGAALALKRGAHFSIEALVSKFSRGWQLFIALLVNGILGGFILVVAVKGLELALRVKTQLSSGMEISMTYPYLAVPVGFAIMFRYLLGSMLQLIKKARSEVK